MHDTSEQAAAAIKAAIDKANELGNQYRKSPYGIEVSNHGLISFPEGLPIVDKEEVIIGRDLPTLAHVKQKSP